MQIWGCVCVSYQAKDLRQEQSGVFEDQHGGDWVAGACGMKG